MIRASLKTEVPPVVTLHYFDICAAIQTIHQDGDLRGFNFWLSDLERNHNPEKLATAFRLTGEYHQFEKKP